MSQRDLITFPGPGGSRVSCCIIPIGCLMLLLVGLLGGGAWLVWGWYTRPSLAQVTPAASMARPQQVPPLPTQ